MSINYYENYLSCQRLGFSLQQILASQMRLMQAD